jgi:hypothetical protein
MYLAPTFVYKTIEFYISKKQLLYNFKKCEHDRYFSSRNNKTPK